MKDWITIGQLAKKTGLTARAIRFYEAKGLLKSHYRGDNDYRFYSKAELSQALQIKNFRNLGFTLGEIAELLTQDPALKTTNLQSSLAKKLTVLQAEQLQAAERIHRLETLIASLTTAHKLSEPQRRIIMEELITQATQKIEALGVNVSKDIEHGLRQQAFCFFPKALTTTTRSSLIYFPICFSTPLNLLYGSMWNTTQRPSS